MNVANGKWAVRRAWLGVAAVGVLAGSLALAGAPQVRREGTGNKGLDRQSPLNSGMAEQTSGGTSAIGVSHPSGASHSIVSDSAHLSGSKHNEDIVTADQVRGGQMPAGDFPVIANMVVDYRNDEMSKARARGELVGPWRSPVQQGGVATGGCSVDVQCDDTNPCTFDSCVLQPGAPLGSGKCEYDPVADGGSFPLFLGCTDGEFCNGFEACQGAVCAGGSSGKLCDGGDNDGDGCLIAGDCPGGACVSAVGQTCDSHSDCQTPGTCNATTGQCTTGGPGACTTNFDCGISGTGSCNPGLCTPGQVPTCCADRDGCLPDFSKCDGDSDNAGDPCDVNGDCRGGLCQRCTPLCVDNQDCLDLDKFPGETLPRKCNGNEACSAKKCYGGTNNGNSCTDDTGCPGGGKCLGTCIRGTPPCGFGADCEEGLCYGGTAAVANKGCTTNGQCPGDGANIPPGECVLNRCSSGAAKACKTNSDCTSPATCVPGPAVCLEGRCCTNTGEPACTKARLSACTTGNWYAGDTGREPTGSQDAPGCGGEPATGGTDPEGWGCPKYAAGMTQTTLANPPVRLVEVGPVSDATICVKGPGGPGGTCPNPMGPAGKLNSIGDDYTITNSSHMGLDVFRWVGRAVTAADRLFIEFYDASGNFIEDIVMDPVTGSEVGIIVVQFQPPLTIPSTGYVVATVAHNFTPNTRFTWLSTTAPVVGTNDGNKLWVNGAPATGAANFLGAGNAYLAFELVGDKEAPPGGACCNATTGDCADGVLPWVCFAQGNNFNGLNSKCASCNAGPDSGGLCRTCSGNGTTPCTSNAQCVGNGTCTPDNGECDPHPGGFICSNNVNQNCTNVSQCPAGVGVTCGPPQCLALGGCASGACCNPTSGGCSVVSGPSSCNGVCVSNACSGGVGHGQPCTIPADCVFFQGFGTDCDADDGKDDAAQHCCPQPKLGLKCMGGPNNLATCTNDTQCRFCVEGPNNGLACTVHSNCARCMGGTNNNETCSVDTDCPDPLAGACTGHCLGKCESRNTGADNCEDAYVHVITVPNPGDDPVTISISGNNSTSTSTVDNPDSCFGIPVDPLTDDTGWWEAFSIDDCAFVRIDFCCTKPVHEPAYPFITSDCDCNDLTFNAPNPYHPGEVDNFRGDPYCEEDNLWMSYGPLTPGIYRYPVLSDLLGHRGKYQMHFTVEACSEAACCKPDASCVDSVNQGECDALGGYFLALPQLSPAVALCVATTPGHPLNPCTEGSCCIGPGDCRDQVSETNPTVMTKAICDTAAPGGNPGTFTGGIRCAGGTCSGGGDAGESCRVNTECADGTCVGTTEQLAQPSPCPICQHLTAATCDFEFGNYVWLSDLSAVGAGGTVQANDIMPTSTGVLERICVTGVYNKGGGQWDCEDEDVGNGPIEDSFRVRLYAPDPNRYFPGEILGEWFPAFVTNRENPRNLPGIAPQHIIDVQMTLDNNQSPLVTLQQGQVYFLEVAADTTNGDPTCNFWMVDADTNPPQGNSYAFLDSCGLPFTEDSVKLFVTDPTAMQDPAWCINVPYEAPPSPVRACCTGDTANPCQDLTILGCAEIAGDWQFGQNTCSGYICPVEPNDVCARAPFVEEGFYGFNMFGAELDGDTPEACEDSPTMGIENDIWYFYTPTASGLAYISTCDCERGGDTIIAVYEGDPGVCPCPGDASMNLATCRDDINPSGTNFVYPNSGCPTSTAQTEILLNVTAGSCLTIRVGMFENAAPTYGTLQISLSPAKCGDGIRQAVGGEQCDPGDPDGSPVIPPSDALCVGNCSYNCQCPPTVCGKQCVGGSRDGLACSTLADCPLGTSCEGILQTGLGEECDASAPGGAVSCTSFNTVCRPPGDPDGECTCVPVCPNGRKEGGEVCDGSDDDACGLLGCNANCRCNTVCGNGILETGERCDPGGISGALPNDALCKTRCIASGPDACTCPEPSCGNGFVEKLTNDEQCDNADPTGEGDCPPEECRPLGDPAGECTCTCASGTAPPSILWSGSDPLSANRTTRTLKFQVQPPVVASGSPESSAIKVTMLDLEHPLPAYQPSANPLPKNFTTFDTTSNGTCSNGAHAGHHCDTAADCRLCGGVGANTNRPCASDTDCPGGFCPTSVCSGDARRPCSLASHCTGFGTCGAPIAFACGGLAACTAAGEGNGCARWVGKPERFRERQEVDFTPLDYLGARLQCTPYYHDWVTATATETVAVFGAEILPNSRYNVEAYSSSCKGAETGCGSVSAPVEMRTRRSGDVVSAFNPPATTTQPDATDIGQLVAKFKSQAGSPSNSSALIQPNVPDGNSDVGASDIVQGVDAAKSFVYSFGGPCPCPSLAVCGALACPSGAGTCVASALPGLGPESTCIKLCRGGTNAGEQCNNHRHCGGGGVCDKECLGGANVGLGCSSNGDCPGSTCAVVTNNAFCRDKCQRCKP